ncbi:DDE-type integrase/transposase/recombinase [Sphingosinicellaceae bacterium]|nr:DDE-type integrase/transposase/recombinase [Sphingosinicellaceae bacterium]QXQ05611.1 DDE-type integrase/transposase/recombinase [Sphingosinicellaceae bacterium]QXQ05641.1 DDE-type integrase/transposase/recombinase [Sphingosinicellaceae bacterium]QXQ05653.1 DDE-type integrase/transposase/recombinase [Sphingosinicellaceae bacterium]QXQ05736.1 DDE-type integrase/transposase/recombinase [Sphingosinicellaceae bacterium]
MRTVSMATRTELVAAISERYRSADRASKGRVLDEFVAVTGFHRKHAMRLMRAGPAVTTANVRIERRIYDEAARTALIVLWEAADRLCGKRLRPLIPILLEAMERHGHLDLAPAVRSQLTKMSAATIDRVLRAAKAGNRKPRRRGVAGTALRQSVPIRTFDDWDNPAPGYVEADLVSHSGPVAKGSFAWTFTLTDIATGWTECAPLLVREQTVLVAVLSEVRRLMPFPLLGFDTDNDSVFINETVRDYCAASDIAFTRCRPYRKNDQAWVEQKNGSVVRRLAGYRRFEGLEATVALAELYAASRLFVNFFQPSFKLAEKHRDGARVRKRYHAPATPYQRLLDDPRVSDKTRTRVRAIFADLDPVRLLRDIRAAQQRLVALADMVSPVPVSEQPAAPPLDAFLSSLQTIWQGGEARPTASNKPVIKRGRRRPDPLIEVSEQLKRWFEDEPWRTGRELLEKLQVERPDNYPDGLIRTVQRRLKVWRSEYAHALVFTHSGLAAESPTDTAMPVSVLVEG